MAMADTWYAYFHVRGTFDPNEITRRTGVAPSQIAHEGDSLPRGSAKRLCSSWELRSTLEHVAPIEMHVKDVLNQMDTNKTEFTQLSREFGGTMQLVGYFRERSPGVHFDRETVLRISEYSLCIDCDFYDSQSR
jgi:hypothetical protein